jgi:5-formyltetrahydrofolate cyclo-ligase
LLLRFESNGPHRHRRVTLPETSALRTLPLRDGSPGVIEDSASAAAREPLRAALRSRRQALSSARRAHAAKLVARHIGRLLHLRPGSRVALYAAVRGELPTEELIALARRRGWRIYLPRIDHRRRGRKMHFVQLGSRRRTNRLGIEEPQGTRTISPRRLDIVFLPLVGFDARGVRLGAGGGYYDRAFAFRRWRRFWHAPRLIGVAYAFQQVERITPAAHDVLLDAVVTEKGMLRCATG